MKRARRLLKIAAIAALALALLGGAAALAINAKMRADASARIFALGDGDLPAREVAIVLGARVMASGEPSTSLRDRLFVAWKLYEKGKVQKILVTGDHGQSSYNEVRAMYQWLREKGVPASRIYVDHAGFRTLDSMQRAALIFEVDSAIICTQEFHLARSIYLARDMGIDAVGVRADQRRYAKRAANRRREFVARVVAFMDVNVWARQPRYLGQKIPISGDAQESHDPSILGAQKDDAP